MNVFLYILVFLFCAVVLSRSATYLVKTLTKIGQYHRLGDFAISFILMSLVTTLPEFVVALISAGGEVPELSISVILGANIATITLGVGFAAIYAKKIRVKSLIKKKDILYMVGICLVFTLLLMDGTLTRWDALILLMIYSYYIYRLLLQEKRFTSDLVEISRYEYITSIGKFIASFIILILSAQYLVWSVEHISDILSLPITLIGLIVVALGTALPELMFELTAVRENHQDMVLGNIIGSVVTNSAMIMGVVGFLFPMDNLDLELINSSLLIMVIVAVMLLYFVRNDGKITRREGIIMVVAYILFVGASSLVKIL